MVGETKISELVLFSSLNGTEKIPAIQDQSGTWVNGSISALDVGSNIGNSNLMLSGNRTLDNNNFTFGWLKVKQFNATAGTPPDVGEASFTFRGYGTTSGNILMGVGNGSSLFTRWFGSGKMKHESIIDGDNGAEFSNYGTFGCAAYFYGASYGIYTSGGAYGMTANGSVGGLFSGTSIGIKAVTSTGGTAIRAEQGIGYSALYTDGNVQFYNLPTSATGLTAGMIWNDSGTIKIV